MTLKKGLSDVFYLPTIYILQIITLKAIRHLLPLKKALFKKIYFMRWMQKKCWHFAANFSENYSFAKKSLKFSSLHLYKYFCSFKKSTACNWIFLKGILWLLKSIFHKNNLTNQLQYFLSNLIAKKPIH